MSLTTVTWEIIADSIFLRSAGLNARRHQNLRCLRVGRAGEIRLRSMALRRSAAPGLDRRIGEKCSCATRTNSPASCAAIGARCPRGSWHLTSTEPEARMNMPGEMSPSQTAHCRRRNALSTEPAKTSDFRRAQLREHLVAAGIDHRHGRASAQLRKLCVGPLTPRRS